MQLRDYQHKIISDTRDAWAGGARNVAAVAPTGAGKTVIFSSVMRDAAAPSIAIAHRQELVSQISLALARNGVRHRIIGQPALIRNCVNWHLAETGRNFHDPNAHVIAAGVDTLIRMSKEAWMDRIGLWVVDECHHLLADNKWGTAQAMFPNARGLGLTATPTRADGKGLGAHADGVFHALVQGPTMRELIERGFLTEYRIYAPPSDIDLSAVNLSASGDFSPEPLRKAVHKSHIVGDVVQQYLKVAPGKLGVTFAVDVESATEIADAFRAADVPAECISAKTPDSVRMGIQRKSAAGEIKQLINVDLLGEGYDLPAIEVVSMARPTQSYSLFVQQFGRALRLREGKSHAIILDHVGNVQRHGIPDAPRKWTLDARERGATKGRDPDAVPVRICMKCMGAFNRVEYGLICPYCGATHEPTGRSAPEMVDGDLFELDAETLARLRGEVDSQPAYHPDRIVQATINKRHRERGEAQEALRTAMAEWAGMRSTATDDATVRKLQREFFKRFGIDVLSAQALNARDAGELLLKVKGE